MNSNSMYLILNTKVSAMFGKLLKDEDYKKIIFLKSPGEIAMYLKENTAYGEYFENLDPLRMSRDDIERVLKNGLISYMDKLMHYFNGDYRSFFKCFYIKYEISDLKRAARLIHIDKDFERIKENLVFAGKYKYIDIDSVLRAKDMEELINSLENTIYYPYLKNLIDGNKKENLFRFEMSLDKAYFTILEETLKKLSKKDQLAFYNIYGAYIDMQNIQIIYRGKKYFHLTPEELFNYTINRGLRYNYRRIKSFCYLKNEEELGREIRKGPYGFMIKGDDLQDIYMERRMHRYMYFRLKAVKQRYENNISMPLAFMEFIEFQVRDIISIIENVRYGMDYEEARKYLIKAM